MLTFRFTLGGLDFIKALDLDASSFAWVEADYVWRSWLSKRRPVGISEIP